MAEGDIVAYNKPKGDLMEAIHDWGTGGHTLQVTLHTGYTPDIDTHDEFADTGVSSTEYGTAAGYTAGGKVLANQAVTVDNTNDRALFDADDVTWTALGPLTPATPSHAIIWNNSTTTPLDALMFYVELGTTATNGGDYTLQWSTSPSAIATIT